MYFNTSPLWQWVAMGALVAIPVIGFIIYITWVFIMSAVRAGVKDAIKETLLDTGLLVELIKQNKEYKNTSESVSEPK